MSTADQPPITSSPNEDTVTEQGHDMQIPDASVKDTPFQVPIPNSGNTSVLNDSNHSHDNIDPSHDTTCPLSLQQDTTKISTPSQPMEDFMTWPARDEQLLHTVIQHIPFASTTASQSDQWALVATTCNKELEQLVNRPPLFVDGAKAKERFKVLMTAHAALVHKHGQCIEFLPIYEQYERIRSLMEYCYWLYVKSGNEPNELLGKRKRDQDDMSPNEETNDDERERHHEKRMNESIHSVKNQLREMKDETQTSAKYLELEREYIFGDINRLLSEKNEMDRQAVALHMHRDSQVEDLMKTHSKKVHNLLNASDQRIKLIADKYNELMIGFSQVQQQDQMRWNTIHDDLVIMRQNFLNMQIQMFEHQKKMDNKRMEMMRSLMKDS
ncbi:hypothetical protein K492DRAFT_206932 [Lichtheimia hyalospora FSU 10163]|nr:hypothetical protein K492DRAFT_206932 [Lichtheimia hyalospora FSU 10163]